MEAATRLNSVPNKKGDAQMSRFLESEIIMLKLTARRSSYGL